MGEATNFAHFWHSQILLQQVCRNILYSDADEGPPASRSPLSKGLPRSSCLRVDYSLHLLLIALNAEMASAVSADSHDPLP